MPIQCPTCRLIVRVTKAGTIGKHNVAGARIAADTCFSSGKVVMTEMDAWQKYKAQVTPRDVTAPDFTFSGWLRHNRIHTI